MPVKNLLLSLLRPNETGAIAREINLAVKSITDPDPFITKVSGELDTSILNFENRVGKKLKNDVVLQVLEADTARDDLHKNIARYVRGQQYNPVDSAVAAAGEQIYDLLDSHNISLYKEAYTAESNLIDALIIDIEKPEFAGAVATLKLGDAIAQLKQAQRTFEELHVDKSRVASELTVAQIAEFLNPIRDLLPELLTILSSCERREPSKYGKVVAHVNELIMSYNAIARSRKTRKLSTAEPAKAEVSATPVTQ